MYNQRKQNQREHSTSVYVTWTIGTIFLFTLLVTSAHARTGHIAALAVASDDATNGSIADISLEIKPGSGSIFIESYPLTQLDTQVSTRFANEIACKKSTVDCTKYDFFYIIDTKSSVIGGPSAGGAITVLTYAVLEDMPLHNGSAMTGTIMSGGIIGPVGGVRGKVAAASANGFSQVIIPAWESNESGIPLADRYGITILQVKTIDEAIAYFTGSKLIRSNTTPIPPREYIEEMRGISDALCSHARILQDAYTNALPVQENVFEEERTEQKQAEGDAAKENLTDENNTQELPAEVAAQQLIRADNASNRGSHYTAASMCFGAGTTFHRLLLEYAENKTIRNEHMQVKEQYHSVLAALKDMEIDTVADLEVAMIVTERLWNVNKSLELLNEQDNGAQSKENSSWQNQSQEDPLPNEQNSSRNMSTTASENEAATNRASVLAYASERLETARAWMHLFDAIPSKELDVSPQQLAASCKRKIDEAQERVHYLNYIYPLGLQQADASLREAFSDAQQQEYTLCLLHASQAKAEANAIITAVQVPANEIPTVVAEKIRASEEQLERQIARGAFPILGYSYAEYSKELLESDAYSASLYAEYSLEFSSLDIYFPQKTSRFVVDGQLLGVFLIGAGLGIALGIVAGYGVWHKREQTFTQKLRRPKKVPIARNLPGKKR